MTLLRGVGPQDAGGGSWIADLGSGIGKVRKARISNDKSSNGPNIEVVEMKLHRTQS